MSVLKSRRHQSELGVIDKAESLYGYIIRLVSNTRYFPKRYRFAVITDIIKDSKYMVNRLYWANSVRVEDEQTIKTRVEHQHQAKLLLQDLEQQFGLVRRVFYIPGKKLEYVIRKIEEVDKLLSAWQRSDAARYLEQRKQIKQQEANKTTDSRCD